MSDEDKLIFKIYQVRRYQDTDIDTGVIDASDGSNPDSIDDDVC